MSILEMSRLWTLLVSMEFLWRETIMSQKSPQMAVSTLSMDFQIELLPNLKSFSPNLVMETPTFSTQKITIRKSKA